MNVREKLQLNSGGQWLVSPAATKQIFCRETFTEEHKEIKKMVFEFTENKIYPNIEKIDKLDENLSKSIIREMGSL